MAAIATIGVKVFTTTTFAAFAETQLAALTTTQVAALTTSQLHCPELDQVRGLSRKRSSAR